MTSKFESNRFFRGFEYGNVVASASHQATGRLESKLSTSRASVSTIISFLKAVMVRLKRQLASQLASTGMVRPTLNCLDP